MAGSLGWYENSDITFAPSYLANVGSILKYGTRHQQLDALARLWQAAAHEVGHSLGYAHQPTGVMEGDKLPPIPGEGYQFARSVMPPRPPKVRVRKQRNGVNGRSAQ